MLALLAGCGKSDKEAIADGEQPGDCIEVTPERFRKVIGTAPDGKAWAVPTEVPNAPVGLARHSRYLAAMVAGRPAVWAFGGPELGDGLVWSVDPAARKASDIGDLIPQDHLVDLGLGPGDPDYSAALDCLG